MGYPKFEQETVLAYDYDKNVWKAYSTVPKHIRKLMAISEMKIIESENDKPICVQGVLNEKQVTMKKERILSEETKEKLRLRGLALKEKTE